MDCLAIEAAMEALDAASCASEDTETFMTQEDIAQVVINAAQPYWSIQASSVAITARTLLDKILHGGKDWDPMEAKREVRDLLVALQAWESGHISV